MTRFFDATFEGASLTGANGATSVSGTVTLDSGSVVKDTYSALHNTASSLLRFDITASDDIYVSFYLYITTGGASVRTCYITNGCRISIRSDRSLRLEDAAGTAIGSNSGVLSLNTLYRVGLHWKKATGAGNDGQCEAYVSATGSPDAAFGSAFSSSTTLTQTAQLSRVDLGNTSGATANTFYTDDVRIDNASMPGPSIAFTEVDTNFTASASFKKWEATWTASASFAVLVNTDFTASASFQKWEATFTASASFSGTIDNDFTASASFATVVDTDFTASVSFAVVVNTDFTASASFQKWEASWDASASFQKWETTFTAAASFKLVIDKTFTAAASFVVELPHVAHWTVSVSFSVSGNTPYTAPKYWPYPESFVPSYEIRLASPDGEYVDIIDTYSNLDYALVTNDIGACQIELPPNYPITRLVKDARIEVWRSVGFGPLKLEGDTQFLIQGRERSTDDQGKRTLKVSALSLNHILKRRIVAYRGDQLTYVDMADTADNIMKEVMKTNFGSTTVDTSRVIDPAYLVIDDITGKAQTVWKTFPHENILDIFKDLADASWQYGVPLFFDIVVHTPPRKLAFRTWTWTRGTDRRFNDTSSTLVLGFNHGSIGAYTITEDWSNEIGYVYVAGPGEDDVRDVQVAQDNTIIGASPYARSEMWADSQDSQTSDNLLNEAGSLLVAHRVKKLFVGKLLSTPQATYGVHWGWGDYVTADVEDEQFDCYVSGVHVQVASPEGKENIDAALRNG